MLPLLTPPYLVTMIYHQWYLAPSDDDIKPTEAQPLPPSVSPTAFSPDYVEDFEPSEEEDPKDDLEEDPEEEPSEEEDVTPRQGKNMRRNFMGIITTQWCQQ
nr:hypothetical protein [Tanacetum cinerariifolium]